MNSIYDDLKALGQTLLWYIRIKLKYFGVRFEKFKNTTVDIFMHRRGALQNNVWHSAIIVLLIVTVLTSGIFGGQTIVSSTYPGIGAPDPRFVDTYEPFPYGPYLATLQDTHTNSYEKPRSEVINYKVQNGDTLSSIAQKENISQDTIKWANDLDNVDQIKPGQTIKILPVSGVSYVVKSGDTLPSVAKKYSANEQAIVDFPFNDIPDDFSLKVGQILIIPDGTPPEIKAPTPTNQYVAQGLNLTQQSSSIQFVAPGGANFVWPTHGIITQYFSWYHPGDDIANPSSPPIYAADAGTVVYAGWDTTGYGNRTDIDHGNGYLTRYGHQSNIYVTVGQHVSRGELIGQMGSTGRSTGTHLHFEIHYKGIPVNPLSILK